MTEEEFYSKIPEWVEQDRDRWNHITLLAYFCHRYEQQNGVRFRLVRGRKGPTMGKEAGDFAKLFRMLAPEGYSDLPKDKKSSTKKEVNQKIYNYINWMFDYKFRAGGSVTGTKLFHTPSLIVEFERMYNAFLNKKKKKEGIDSLVSWAKDNLPEILENHQVERIDDLKMIHNYMKMYSLGKDSDEWKILKKAKDMGVI